MENIVKRKSIRNYSGEVLKGKDKILIQSYISESNHLKGPFGHQIKIKLIEVDQVNANERIGTYGFIKNAPSFLVSICKNNQENLLDLGFVFEHLILFLEEKNLSTCWIGGTFHRSKLQTDQALSDEEFIPIISPVGYSAKKSGLFNKLIRKMAQSDLRLDFNKLFFQNDFLHPIKESSTREVLKYVRLAPSASNKQPWRILMDENQIAHFYIERTPKYGSALGYDIQMVDMGIALAHYVLVSGKKELEKRDPLIQLPNEHYSYLFSVK